MNTLICTIGCPGSGKNHLFRQLHLHYEKDIVCVEPDEIRQHLLGSVNDQSKGGMIFGVAKQRLKMYTEEFPITYFNATNTNWSRLKKMLKDIDANMLFVFLMDSLDVNLCKQRIAKDLSQNIDRSKVPDEVVERMAVSFEECLANATGDGAEIFRYNGKNFDSLIEVLSNI